jgi:predicted enzyme related to lactoylglutathione lyase
MNRPIHFEILADHPKKVAAFYQSVFDWKVDAWSGSEAYWLVDTGPEGTPGIHGVIMKREILYEPIDTTEKKTLQAQILRDPVIQFS